MASLVHKGGDRWVVRAWGPINPLTGRRRRLTSHVFRAPNLRAARKAMHPYAAALEADRSARAGTVHELISDWLAVSKRDRSPSTMIAYQRHSARIIDRFGRLPVDDLTATNIERWYTALMADGITAAGIHHLHRVFNAALTWGYRKGRVTRVETQRVTLPPHRASAKKPPTVAEVRDIIARLPDSDWARAWCLLAATGLRRGEVVGLRWADWDGDMITVRHSIVELRGGGLHVGVTKGRRDREIVLTAPALTILVEQRRKADLSAVWVFADPEDPAVSARPGWLSLSWARWRVPNGAGGVGLHDLRHWYATVALQSGVPLRSVADQLGHAQTSTTLNIYGHGDRAGRDALVRAIDDAFSGVMSAPLPLGE